MCGIAGFFQTKIDCTKGDAWQKRLNLMKESLVHRGINDADTVLYPHAGFAHTRLSIIDILGGHQPMTKHLGEYKCSIVYNGELYNSRELRETLSMYSLFWETNSDTEVILNGYLAMGEDFVKLLNGIFAFAIYDERKDALLLARDPLGVKPLFFQKTEEAFVFASEQKGLFAYGIKPELNRESFCEVLGLGPARTPGQGVFKDMKELLPGHMLYMDQNTCRKISYYKLKGEEHTDSYEETLDKVKWLVEDSVKRQMVSDVPICTFLSGGLDSSLVSALCQRELKKEGKILQTFSFDFVNNKENFKPNAFQSSLDRPYVDIMVNAIGSKHKYLECDNQTQADYLYKAVDARDLPCMADVESSLLYFCSKVAEEVKVTLTGECADEIFGGYPWFHREEMWQHNTFPWSYDLEPRTKLLNGDFLEALRLSEYVQNAYDKSISETPRFVGDNEKEKRRREISWLNIRWFMATLLNRMDRTSMYSGLEARVPFADSRMLQYVYNIPWEMKCKNGQTKSLLVEAGRDVLPYEISHRKKSPYPKTYDREYEKLLGRRLMECISDKSAPIRDIIDRKRLETFLSGESNYGQPWYGQLMAGPQMIAYLLQINYWMDKYKLKA
ncbi:asparagine synthase (glutamine-hydrolyzing) [Lachnospiraceae bacterium OttesenSCG-928-D06]|nr:asparagine synthase (glutamine-hydrolyzing) [Lachnospiraceae bacterium OttesenSCG-928-D06]